MYFGTVLDFPVVSATIDQGTSQTHAVAYATAYAMACHGICRGMFGKPMPWHATAYSMHVRQAHGRAHGPGPGPWAKRAWDPGPGPWPGPWPLARARTLALGQGQDPGPMGQSPAAIFGPMALEHGPMGESIYLSTCTHMYPYIKKGLFFLRKHKSPSGATLAPQGQRYGQSNSCK